MSDIKLRRLDEYRWEVPREGAMRVPGIIYASDRLMKAMGKDESPKQVANVAQLPGIVKRSLAMPDMHWGYGFPIGGVAAFDLDGGIISPGGVGYDINCGCRLMITNLRREEVRPQMAKIVNALFLHVPSGVGSRGPQKLSRSDEKMIIQNIGEGGLTDMSFTVPRTDAKKILEVMKKVVADIGAKNVNVKEDIAKISIVGVGMRSHSGVAAKMFSSLAKEGINIR